MLGFRGASRYAHPAYADGFALECAALRRVREEMGLTNLVVMVPFCRRVEEAEAGDRGDGAQRPEARRERARDLRHVRDPEQRHPDRRLRRGVRRILDRLQRSDPAHARRRPRFPRSSPSISTSAIPACWRCCGWRSPAPSATGARSAFAARRRRTIPRSPASWRSSGSIRSASTRPACCARSTVVREAEEALRKTRPREVASAAA